MGDDDVTAVRGPVLTRRNLRGAAGGGPGASRGGAPRRGPRRRVLLSALLALVLGLVGALALLRTPPAPAAVGSAVSTPSPSSTPAVEETSVAAPTPVATPTPATTPEPGQVLRRSDFAGTLSGVFRQTSPEAVTEYEQWLGAPVDLVSDYSSRDTWKDISDPGYLLADWGPTGRRLVLGVAMLPEEDPSATIAIGATGAYDDHFTRLATNLVAAGQEDAVLRVGWEANIRTLHWSSDDPVAWTTYWRSIVTAMKAVPGQEFRFDWTINNGSNDHDAVAYYPGDDLVDYIGVDVYDASGAAGTYPIPAACTGTCAERRRELAWDYVIYGGTRGLEFWSSFAAEHDKQLSLPEWGLWDRPDGTGGGDDTTFIRHMNDFIADPANAVGYQVYFEYSGDQGSHRLMTGFPEASALFRQLFGPGTAVDPAATAPAATAPASSTGP